MQIKRFQKHSDLLGVVSAGLCLIHCIALPVFLLSTTAAASVLSAELIAHDWHWLDYFFIALAVQAVYFSAKKATSPYIRMGMWLSVFIFGVSLLLHEISESAQYISIVASMVLILLHFINFRHCKRCSIEKVKA